MVPRKAGEDRQELNVYPSLCAYLWLRGGSPCPRGGQLVRLECAQEWFGSIVWAVRRLVGEFALVPSVATRDDLGLRRVCVHWAMCLTGGRGVAVSDGLLLKLRDKTPALCSPVTNGYPHTETHISQCPSLVKPHDVVVRWLLALLPHDCDNFSHPRIGRVMLGANEPTGQAITEAQSPTLSCCCDCGE